MARNIINLTEQNDTRLLKINAVMAINGKKFKNNSDLINEIIKAFDAVIDASDNETLLNLTGLNKNYLG